MVTIFKNSYINILFGIFSLGRTNFVMQILKTETNATTYRFKICNWLSHCTKFDNTLAYSVATSLKKQLLIIIISLDDLEDWAWMRQNTIGCIIFLILTQGIPIIWLKFVILKGFIKLQLTWGLLMYKPRSTALAF